MSAPIPRSAVRAASYPILVMLVVALVAAPAIARFEPHEAPNIAGTSSNAHLVISELVTGGASASDELIELYNPTEGDLGLDGLEVVYVTASGTTITRKASWASSEAPIPAHRHLLIANAAGVFAAVADLTYVNGLAAAGGSVALRVAGAATAIDAVGWGTAASVWLEGTPAPAPPAGSSLERLPGGAAGSGQDTDDNAVDFIIQPTADPQNAASAPVPPVGSPSPTLEPTAPVSPTAGVTATPGESATPAATASPIASGSESGVASPSEDVTASPAASPTSLPSRTPLPTGSGTPSDSPAPSWPPTESATPAATASPTPAASGTPAPTGTPVPLTIAAVRALPDGASATVVGVALSPGAFTDGGGCVADATAGIAVLVTAGSFARGDELLVSGIVDDRYAQRTLRAAAGDVIVLGSAAQPSALPVATGDIGERTECALVEVHGAVAGAPTTLTSGLAYDIDDGSGSIRVLLGPDTGIDATTWVRGAWIDVIGVAGQRDSSGTGTAGYRVLPRDPADVVSVLPPPTPTPVATQPPTPAPTASPTASASATVSATASISASPQPSAMLTERPTATPAPSSGEPALTSIVQARSAVTNTKVRVRGTVTLGSGLVDASTAVIQDPSAGIALRLGDEAGTLSRGAFVEVYGTRSTKAGMLTIRVDVRPVALGTLAEPTPVRAQTGAIGERLEAILAVARGKVTTVPARSSAGNVAFSIDDGSGPLRVTVYASARISLTGILKGSWIEVVGVVGQTTTGSEPDRGYRLWPRGPSDVRIVAAAGGGGTSASPASPRASTAREASGSEAPSSTTPVSHGFTATDAWGVASPAARPEGPTVGSGTDLLGGAHPGAADAPQLEAASGPSVPLRPAGLLSLAAALAVASTTLAWRGGAIARLAGRLRRLVQEGGDSQDGEQPDDPWGSDTVRP